MSSAVLTIVHALDGSVSTNAAIDAALDMSWPDHHVLVLDATPTGALDALALTRADDDRMAWVRAEGMTSTSAVLEFAALAFRHSYVSVQPADRVPVGDKLSVQMEALHNTAKAEVRYGAVASLPPKASFVGDGSGERARAALAQHAPGALYRTSVLRVHRDVLEEPRADVEVLHALALRGITCRWLSHQPWEPYNRGRPATTVYTLPLYGLHVPCAEPRQLGVMVDAPWMESMTTMAVTRRIGRS